MGTTIAQTATDVLIGVVSVQGAVIIGLIRSIVKTRERLVKIEEWARLEEKKRDAPR